MVKRRSDGPALPVCTRLTERERMMLTFITRAKRSKSVAEAIRTLIAEEFDRIKKG